MALVKETGKGTIIDLGSGWGNFVFPIARQMPERQVIGYELSLFPWLISTIIKNAFCLHNLTLYRKNFYHEKLPDASVIVCYLYPQAMNKVKRKLLTERPNVDFLISNNFALPFAQASKKIQLSDFYKSPVYLYHIAKITA